MSRVGPGLLAVLTCLTLAGGPLHAQGPRAGYVYPAGGQQGTTFAAVVGGQQLRGAFEAYVSGSGVHAEVIEFVSPLGNNELYDISRIMRNLVRSRWSLPVMRAAATDPDPPVLPDHPAVRDLDRKSLRELGRLQARLFDPKKQPNAQIADQVVLRVTVDPAAAPGDRDLRLLTPGGLTNPVRFQVGTLPELTEESFDRAGEPLVANLPVVLNGQIMPGEVDRFPLRAQAGQQFVFRLQARQLIPYLADAVPGWFQATLALYGPDGRELAFDDDYGFDPDPVLVYRTPVAGVYRLEVRDAIYRGREDFVYRLSAGELPFLTTMFPLGGREGAAVTATLGGWNLPAKDLPLDMKPGEPRRRLAALTSALGPSNALPYAVDTLPEVPETEPNDSSAAPQAVTLPVLVNGRIGRAGDVDAFQFEGKAGQELVAEVQARRLNSPLDGVLKLYDATGRAIAWNDDQDDPQMGLMTFHADPYLRATLAQDGVYVLTLGDTRQQGGGDYGYRLRLGPPRPDFALRVTPSGVSVMPGRAATVTVRAVRLDGFDGDIDLKLGAAPPGFTLSAGRIAQGKDSVPVTLTAPRDAPRGIQAWQIVGQAQIGGAAVSHVAVPAEDMMQAFAYQHLVPQQELLAAVPDYRRVPVIWRPLAEGLQPATAGPVRIPLGGTAPVLIKLPVAGAANLRFELANKARGVRLESAVPGPGGVTLTVRADAYIAAAGEAANLIFEAYRVPPAPARPVSLGVLPAIPYQIVQP